MTDVVGAGAEWNILGCFCSTVPQWLCRLQLCFFSTFPLVNQ